MVDIQQMKVDDTALLGISMYMSHYPMYLLMSTHFIMLPEMFELSYFKKPDCAVCICGECTSVHAMLKTKIIKMNDFAKEKGIVEGMSVKEAISLL